MSNISDYQALVAAMTVAFTSQASKAISLTAKDATALQNAYDSADTPVRLLLPYGGGESMSAEIENPDEQMGPNFFIRWTFSDVLLWRHVPFGEGIGDSAYDLREYAAAYMVAAEALEQTGITDRMTKERVLVQVQSNLNFPVGSGEFFTGAVATWTVTEDDPPT
jgi:hypothetical protein